MRMILVLLLMLMIQPFAFSQQSDSTKVRDTLPGSNTRDTLNRTKIRDTVQMGSDKKPVVIITADTLIKGEKKILFANTVPAKHPFVRPYFQAGDRFTIKNTGNFHLFMPA